MKYFFTLFFVILCALLQPTGAFAQYSTTNVQDSLALVALYDSTDGAHWINNSGWLQGPVATWYGISRDANPVNSRVLEIGLPSNGLKGTIPHELGNLSVLQTLYLGNNQLSGSIPAELGNLQRLVEIDLPFNQLSGSIPTELGNASQLRYLLLDHNQFDNVPSSLGNTPLRNLTLNNNKLTFNGLEGLVKNFYSHGGVAPVSYYSQAEIYITDIDSILSVSAGGTLQNNTYKWYTTDGNLDTTITGDSTFKPTKSGNYYVNVTNSIATVLYLFSDTVNYCGVTGVVLPVKLLSFTATEQNKGVALSWQSTNEVNSSSYMVERSKDAVSFTSFQTIQATTDGKTIHTYSAFDSNPLNGTNFYRLQQVDKNGNFTYSEVRSINISVPFSVAIIPNPVKSNTLSFTIKSTEFCTVQLQIINAGGNVVSQQSVSISTGVNTKTTNISNLTKGIYFMKLITPTNTTLKRFMKVN